MFAYEQPSRRQSIMSSEGDGHNANGVQEKKREEYIEGNLKLCHAIEGNAEVMCQRFSQDGGVLAVGQSNGTIRIYSADTGQNLHSLSDDATHKQCVTSIRFIPYDDGDKIEHKHLLMATYASGNVKFWHYTSGKCMQTIAETRQTLSSAFSHGGARFVTVGADSQINLYDTETKQRVRTMEPSDSRDVMNGHRSRIFAAQYHPVQVHNFITGGWDDTVQFWDDRQIHAARRIYGPHICGEGLDIDPLHGHIITGSWRKDKTLQIWDFGSGEMIKTVPQDSLHGSLIYCCAWLGKESIVCGGGAQNMLRVIDRGTLNTVGQLVDLPQAVVCLDSDRQARPKIAAGAACKTYILKMEKKQS